MPLGGRGHVEVYAPKDMSDNEALAQLVAGYRPDGAPKTAQIKPVRSPARRRSG
jgi:hypothetical protein